MKTLYIIRGPFATLKDEFAHSICDTVVSCWDYYNKHGEHHYSEKLKPQADSYCREHTKEILKDGNIEKIAVVNTLSKRTDLEPYKEMAKKYGYYVYFVIADNEITEDHRPDVPMETIKEQVKKFEHNAFDDPTHMMWL